MKLFPTSIDILPAVVEKRLRAGLMAPAEQRQAWEDNLNQALDVFSVQVERGIETFEQYAEAELMERVRAACHSLQQQETGATTPARGSLSDGEFNQLIAIAFGALNGGKLEHAVGMLSLLACFRPEDSRPTIGLVTIVWRTQGVRAAAELYQQLTAGWHDPDLAYFAAECMRSAGWLEQAAIALDRGIRGMQSMPVPWEPSDHELLDAMFSLQKELDDEHV